jgi:acyl transferase domain-containing protein
MNVHDKAAAGFIPGEGCGFVMLKRLEDARRDGDRIYAVLRGWGISSDGKGGIMTPTSGGQALAIRRAYTTAGYTPADLDFVEGHGTGTSVGDVTELKGVHAAQTHPENGTQPLRRRTGMTSLKSIIGHTKAAAGIGAFIKATMAVNRRVLPPTGSCTVPNPVFNETCHSLFPLTHGEIVEETATIRAGVSAMGFGGINSHVTLESGDAPNEKLAPAIAESKLLVSNQTSEIFVFTAASFAQLATKIDALLETASQLSCSDLIDLSADLSSRANNTDSIRAALVASTVNELVQRLQTLSDTISTQPPDRGIAVAREIKTLLN